MMMFLLVPAIVCPAPAEPTREDAVKAADALAERALVFKSWKKKEAAALCEKLHRHVTGKERLKWSDEKSLLDEMWGGFAVRHDASSLLKSPTPFGGWALKHFRGKLVDRLRTIVRESHDLSGAGHSHTTATVLADKLLTSL